MGEDWPFEVGGKPFPDRDEDEDDSDDGIPDYTTQEKDDLWKNICGNVADPDSSAMETILELSDPSIFMMMGLADMDTLNDLIFLDYVTESSYAYEYMVYVFYLFC